jgi:hypothetical protein
MASLNMFIGTMLFYVLLSYVVMPVIFYYYVEKTLLSAGNGFVAGSLLSVILWYTFRSQIV